MLLLAPMKPKDIFTDIEILDTTIDGQGVARIEDYVVFIQSAVTGDVVDLEITRKKRKHAYGKIAALKIKTDKRTVPFCEHFDLCGGCTWQHVKYKEQIVIKQKHVEDSFSRIGKVEVENILPIIPSDETSHYRNRLDYTFSSKRWLTSEELKNPKIKMLGGFAGFHFPGRFDKIIDINTCHLQPEPSNAIRNFIKNFALEREWTFYDPVTKTGFIRDTIIRNTTTGEWMVIVVFHSDETEKINSLMQSLTESFPQITSLNYVINPKNNPTIYDLEVHLFSRRESVTEKIGELKFKISPKSFFQTNTKQAAVLYKTALDFAELKSNEIVYDLYTGTGTIANFISHRAKKVIGIDYITDAIEDAKVNSQLNNISNTEFFAGDIKETLNDDFISAHGQPDVIITDPPRSGMHPDVVKKISDMRVHRIVYVSCNPATQARDIALLSENYRVIKMQAVDMFPHTSHVENVALLEHRQISNL
ncbi:MAG: 23S rRNA (uracil(1939)-C(5))-methyltransferase RlmD [Bacteroidia bacterium]|nr:23S rRNA (uracil(1939)-C(5))-methyltransferase RlmD [Bacteroidia bacterium]